METETSTAPSTDSSAAFITEAYAAAKLAQHIWPDYAACEAALDSQYGETPQAIHASNLFNFRAPAKLPHGIRLIAIESQVKLPNGQETNLAKDFILFASQQDCFAYRMGQLKSTTMFYLALRAKTGADYLSEMAKLSADPQRAEKVAAIHTQYASVFA